jgi:hypothetical protein
MRSGAGTRPPVGQGLSGHGHFVGVAVDPSALPRRVSQPPVARELPVDDLTNQPRLDPACMASISAAA